MLKFTPFNGKHNETALTGDAHLPLALLHGTELWTTLSCPKVEPALRSSLLTLVSCALTKIWVDQLDALVVLLSLVETLMIAMDMELTLLPQSLESFAVLPRELN
jgi:hypothetical protein